MTQSDALALIDALDAVEPVDTCDCGRPRSEHTFWNDRVYDLQGLDCPGGHGREYRFNRPLTVARHKEARALALFSAFTAPMAEAVKP